MGTKVSGLGGRVGTKVSDLGGRVGTKVSVQEEEEASVANHLALKVEPSRAALVQPGWGSIRAQLQPGWGPIRAQLQPSWGPIRLQT